jgi:hypothetical protein
MTGDAERSSEPPDFSIIVPVYNTEAYVEKCLLSILGQTAGSLELIVVDDGSTDRSPQICRRIAEADPRVHLIRQQNGGAGRARNAGVRLARGKYIGFVDSDDWIEDLFCAATAEMMKDGADFACVGLDFVREDGTTLRTVNGYTVETLTGREIFLSALLDNNVLTAPWCKVYRREMLVGNGIAFPSIRAFEDTFFSRAMARVSKVARFDRRVLYHALERRESTTRAFTADKFACVSELFDLERRAFEDDLRDPHIARLFDAHVVQFLAFLLFLAAFRIGDDDELRRCRSVAAASGFDALVRDRRVMRLLRLRVRLAARLASRPGLMRHVVRLAKGLGFHPY